MTIGIFILILGTSLFSYAVENNKNKFIPEVKINIEPYSIIYEGDIIDCDVSAVSPYYLYWTINNQSHHTTFYNDDPVIFDPEPTPLNTNYVNLTVHIGEGIDHASDTVKVMIKRIYFGDIHWHSTFGDGDYKIDEMYKNAVVDNYLDFTAITEHKLTNPFYHGIPFPIIRMLIDRLSGRDSWTIIKNKAIEYYNPGIFTTLLGFEWSPSNLFPGGWKWSSNGYEDIGHINFYYRDIYPEAPNYSPLDKIDYDEILTAMSDEWDKGHLNIGFPHHTLGVVYWFGKRGIGKYLPFFSNTNWSFLRRELKNSEARDKILRGVEAYSIWGTSIGQYSNIPIAWPYLENISCPRYPLLYNKIDSWIEYGMWEWSENPFKRTKFVMQAGSDMHHINRPGSAKLDREKPSGLIAAYTVHNTRAEIWDAMNDCDIYGSQLLKIRANVCFDGQMALGKWINCSSPLNITITALSTFPGNDNSGKNMCPHGYSSNELSYPIQDIWLIKKDTEKGKPWCKVINHTSPNKNLVVASYQDYDVQPNDFYYVAIRQKGQELKLGENEYTTFIGPVFIENVV